MTNFTIASFTCPQYTGKVVELTVPAEEIRFATPHSYHEIGAALFAEIERQIPGILAAHGFENAAAVNPQYDDEIVTAANPDYDYLFTMVAAA